ARPEKPRHHREDEVERPDILVIGGEEPAGEEGRHIVRCVGNIGHDTPPSARGSACRQLAASCRHARITALSWPETGRLRASATFVSGRSPLLAFPGPRRRRQSRLAGPPEVDRTPAALHSGQPPGALQANLIGLYPQYFCVYSRVRANARESRRP